MLFSRVSLYIPTIPQDTIGARERLASTAMSLPRHQPLIGSFVAFQVVSIVLSLVPLLTFLAVHFLFL